MDDDLGLYVPYCEPAYDSTEECVTAPTREQILHAQQLRLQIRESFLKRPALPPSVWMVHVD